MKEGDLSDIGFNDEDIANAINKLKKNSAGWAGWHSGNTPHKHKRLNKNTSTNNPKEEHG